MARPKAPVSGNRRNTPKVLTSSASVDMPQRPRNPKTERGTLAKSWQVEAYRHLNICGEARYAATLFASMAGRAEIGIAESQSIGNKPTWVNAGVEVEALAELAPTERERAKILRDYMIHRIVAGECYLIARDRVDTDPGYYEDPTAPLWEIVAVTELRRVGDDWSVRHENGEYISLKPSDPAIRLWCPDPENRQEAWSPFRSMLPTLREIEWHTRHIFAQVSSRLQSAGVWFLPNNLTYPEPPPSAVQGGAEAIAKMNDATKFMASLAASAMQQLGADEVSLPTIVLTDPAALEQVEQGKLIQFWSEIDEKTMVMRSDAVRRFALGMDLPPEQVLGSSGLAVTGAGGSAGSVNHWGVWANEEQTISAHIEPALDDFTGALTAAYLRLVCEGTDKIIGYDTATLRLRQDRSKEALELWDRGLLSAAITLKETGFDPQTDAMDDKEFKRWLLTRVAGGSATPEQVQSALGQLGVVLSALEGESGDTATRQPGRNNPPSLKDHPYEGPPREDHEHNDAVFGAREAACEVLVLRAMEKAGNRLLNTGLRGKDRDRSTPLHMAHLVASAEEPLKRADFDFSLLPVTLPTLSARGVRRMETVLSQFCADLCNHKRPYSRDALLAALSSGWED